MAWGWQWWALLLLSTVLLVFTIVPRCAALPARVRRGGGIFFDDPFPHVRLLSHPSLVSNDQITNAPLEDNEAARARSRLGFSGFRCTTFVCIRIRAAAAHLAAHSLAATGRAAIHCGTHATALAALKCEIFTSQFRAAHFFSGLAAFSVLAFSAIPLRPSGARPSPRPNAP